MRFSDIRWYPSQLAHFTETVAAFMFGYISVMDTRAGVAAGLVQVAQKEGEDLYYKYKSGKFAAGDVLDLVIHLFGIAIPVTIIYALT